MFLLYWQISIFNSTQELAIFEERSSTSKWGHLILKQIQVLEHFCFLLLLVIFISSRTQQAWDKTLGLCRNEDIFSSLSVYAVVAGRAHKVSRGVTNSLSLRDTYSVSCFFFVVVVVVWFCFVFNSPRSCNLLQKANIWILMVKRISTPHQNKELESVINIPLFWTPTSKLWPELSSSSHPHVFHYFLESVCYDAKEKLIRQNILFKIISWNTGVLEGSDFKVK